ncbi:MAG: class I SAM-dependent methyltransferase [Candidatus Marinimicrobia bacterium]|nr:class I SAM-dependent methyltransferase [Candidatus Neomarinimicrobiota bacterium]MCF7827657.1 class I SAM-dependent methyltransferase [Candidatus Neomarinimicrobiota bacterium]MCF7881288.1 class I SAM-dependent methyltransferase [Candidatus Neomarinimicrobiota bacterium]
MAKTAHQQSVVEYYESNHNWLRRTGRRSETGAMHREVWGPEVTNRREALNYINQLIAEDIVAYLSWSPDETNVLDVGCGIGGTCVYFAKHSGMHTTGITLSHQQLADANRLAAENNISERCDFHRCDFLTFSRNEHYEVATAIESFVHMQSAKLFFEKLTDYLVAGGLLIICDDLRTSEPGSNLAADKWLRRFRDGWHLGQLPTVHTVTDIAGEYGFDLLENRDLTPYLQSDSLIWQLLDGLAYLIPVQHPFLDSRRGNVAHRITLSREWVQYRYLVFRRSV